MSSFEVEQTFRNIVRFYAEEFVQVNDGAKASVFFNDNQRKTFTKMGILQRVYNYRGCRLVLSEKAKLLIEHLNGFSLPSIELEK